MSRSINLTCRIAIVGLSLAGCGTFSPRPDPSRFFTLSSLPQMAQASPKDSTGPEKMFLGIGPIKFPGYLDRQEIVVRSGQNRLEVSEPTSGRNPYKTIFPGFYRKILRCF